MKVKWKYTAHTPTTRAEMLLLLQPTLREWGRSGVLIAENPSNAAAFVSVIAATLEKTGEAVKFQPHLRRFTFRTKTLLVVTPGPIQALQGMNLKMVTLSLPEAISFLENGHAHDH